MNQSLYGKYAGILENNKEYLQNCSEIELFIQVNAYYEPINSYNTISNNIDYLIKMIHFYKTTEEKELEEYFIKELVFLKKKLAYCKNPEESYEFAYPMDYCILQTKRFGTKVKYNKDGRVILTDEFKEWYNNWQTYMTYMDNETLQAYRTCRYEGKGLEYFQLNKYLEKESIIEKIETIKTQSHKPIQKSIKQKLA